MLGFSRGDGDKGLEGSYGVKRVRMVTVLQDMILLGCYTTDVRAAVYYVQCTLYSVFTGQHIYIHIHRYRGRWHDSLP